MVESQEIQVMTLTTNQGHVILVDPEDYARVVAHNWTTVSRPNTSYAIMSRKFEREYLHRFILNLVYGQRVCVDHINGNGLDCRKTNMRIADWTQNAHNTANGTRSTTGYIGVYTHPNSPRFIARARINGKKVHLGMFATAEEAARAYDYAVYEKVGEFAHLNFT